MPEEIITLEEIVEKREQARKLYLKAREIRRKAAQVEREMKDLWNKHQRQRGLI